MTFSERLQAVDSFQQRHRRLSFLAAVMKKFGDDGAGRLAALIAYYGFFSLFPLLLVFVTVLGFVLEGNPNAQESVLHSTLSQFPIIGNQLEENVHSLKGSGVALAIGVIGSLLAGLGITGATRNAFDEVWHVPRKQRPNFLAWRLRGLGLLIVLGTLTIVSTAVAGYVTAPPPARWRRSPAWCWRWRPTCCCSSPPSGCSPRGRSPPATCSPAWWSRRCCGRHCSTSAATT